jgi:hypothetical protein
MVLYERVRVFGFNVTFNNITVYHGGQSYCWKNPVYPEKTTCRRSSTNFITICFIEYTSP